MPTRKSWSAYGNDASYFVGPGHERRPNHVGYQRSALDHCAWRPCENERYLDTPVCIAHAVSIAHRVENVVQIVNDEVPNERWQPREYVYYLMVAPEIVKIGTTANLQKRIASLRTDLQYVIALEKGGSRLERERHREFSLERVGRRENFRLTERLRAHIEPLMDSRDTLVVEATTEPFGEMVPVARQSARRVC